MKFFRMLITLALICSTGCYTTRVGTPNGTQEYDHGQWFTLGGFVELSDPHGDECSGAIAYSESRLAATDILIGIGLAIVGGIAGGVACTDPDSDGWDADASACASSASSLAPFLLGRRTVTYQCVAGSR